MRAVFKADGEETGNRYCVSEWWLDPHKPGPGAHKHDANEEIFYVLEGTPSMLIGEQWIDAPKGSFLRIPAGVMHDFENRTDARIGLLNVFIPGGFEPMMPMIAKWFGAGGAQRNGDRQTAGRPGWSEAKSGPRVRQTPHSASLMRATGSPCRPGLPPALKKPVPGPICSWCGARRRREPSTERPYQVVPRLNQRVQEEATMAYQDTIGAGQAQTLPRVRKITPRDLVDALKKGLDDFWAMPTHVVFLSLIYPIVGLLIAQLTFGYDFLPLLYPMAAGFALVGPFASIGIYELSRRREQGLDTEWSHAFDLLQADSFRAILALGLILVAIFGVWVAVAQAIYIAHFGYAAPESIESFVRQVLTTSAGHRMILIGNGVGFLFALVAFSIGVVAFPLLIDRHIGPIAAAATSVKAVLRNPLTMALWGLIVAVTLLIASLPLFIGLAVAIPVLGHSTWHLYRKMVVTDLPRREFHPAAPKGRRYAADFPASLFPVFDKEPRS